LEFYTLETIQKQQRRREFADGMSSTGASNHRFFIKGLARLMAPEGLTPRQFFLIHQVHTQGPLSQSDLAEFLSVEGQTMVKLIDALEREGWVRRVPDAHDRRINRIHLAAQPERLKRVLLKSQIMNMAAMTDFTEEELGTFSILQEKFNQGLTRFVKELKKEE
jgi:DNA-binding MarR family transcriptional regulator